MSLFTNGEILSAYKLNSISRNVHYLAGLFGGANIPAGTLVIKSLVDAPADATYYIRHKFRYLHYDIGYANYDTVEEAYIYFDGDEIHFEEDDTPPLTGVIDLHDTGILAVTPTVGQWYPITFIIEILGGSPGTDKLRFNYIFESDVTSLTPGTTGTPYQAPKIWSHGEFPTAAELNKYSNSLGYLYDRIGGGSIQPAILYNRSLQTTNTNDSNESGFHFFHKYRWFHYLNSTSGAEITDPAGVGDDVSLGDSGEWTTLDLETVDWMTPGKIYYVKFVTCCAEDSTP